jgi:hypothetical protein
MRMKNGIPGSDKDPGIFYSTTEEVMRSRKETIKSRHRAKGAAPDQGKGVKSPRRPATVIVTNAVKMPLSEWMGRHGK